MASKRRRTYTSMQTVVLFMFIYAMVLSRLLLGEAGTGGALFLCGRLSLLLTGSLYPDERRRYSKRTRVLVGLASFLLLAVNFAMMLVYPPQASAHLNWLLFGVILTLLAAENFGTRLTRFSVSRRMADKRYFLLYWFLQLSLLVTGTLLLNTVTSGQNGWVLTAGYLLLLASIVYAQLKYHAQLVLQPPPSAEQMQRGREVMRKANAWTIYQLMQGLIAVAMNLTLVLLYSWLALTAEEIIIAMAISLVAIAGVRELFEFITARRSGTDPINAMTLGFFLWGYGLFTANRLLQGQATDMISYLLCAAVCTAGICLCTNCLERISHVMDEVGRYTSGRTVPVLDDLENADWESAGLLAQLFSLTAMTAISLLGGFGPGVEIPSLGRWFRPIMLLPAGITVLAAFLASLRYPFTRRYNEKLSRLLCMREVGDDNDALARQVDKVMSGKRRRPIGTHSVMAILRPFFRHRLQGREALDEALRSADGPVVFLCNHGEFYGPVAGMLFIPVDVRPWTISEIVDDAEEMARYFHKYTISPITWIPERLKMPLCLKFFGPLSVWAMDQLEAIPVYRNKPTMLMKTMRLSVEALQAGDNILIFPENPDADVDNRGYEHSGLGTLFSGFALLAEIYFNRTGKRLHFVPMYCHKGRRTMTFGQQIVYDPENESAAERERISGEAEQEMRRIWVQEEALYTQETRSRHRRQH